MANNNEIPQITVDEDILIFLKAIYFGDLSNTVEAASRRAYLDMNRTIRFEGMMLDRRIGLREKANKIFEKKLETLFLQEIKCQDDFDFWHRQVCNMIRQIYRNESVMLTNGQAQKWVNMTIKYLYVLGVTTFDDIFGFLHIPLDNYVFDIAKKSLGIDKPKLAWSKWDDYDDHYLQYQKEIREKVTCYEPFRWEFRHWLKAARNVDKF